ncbi:MAG: Acylphosphatase [Chlamydiae bacterium]|nr:Acylphosphatase [Chlamydiota bacterium]
MEEKFSTEDAVELHAIVHGRVQGVFFRAGTRDIAVQLGITGTVKNLPDGTVEIYAQSTRQQLGRLLEMLQSDSGPGHVYSIDKEYSPPLRSFPDFRVTY